MDIATPDPMAALRARLRTLLHKVTDLVAGRESVDFMSDLGIGDEVDSLALAIHLLRRPVPVAAPHADLLAAMPLPTARLDATGMVRAVNAAWLQRLGLAQESVLHQPLRAGFADPVALLAWLHERPQMTPSPARRLVSLRGHGPRDDAQSEVVVWAWPHVDRGWQLCLVETNWLDVEPTLAPEPAARPLRVLVVDDDAIVGHVTVELLLAAGFAPTLMEGGPQALRWFAATPEDPDLLLVDMSMPDITGPQLVERLAERLTAIPVVFMTGYLDPGLAAQLEKNHRALIVRKPFTLHDLVRTLHEALARRSAGA